MQGRAGYVVAVVLLLVGIGAAAVLLGRELPGVADELQQIVVPGEHEIALSQSGRHTIFHEQRTAVGGRFFATDRPLTGLMFRMTSMPAGDEIPIEPPATRTRYTVGGREGSSIATFTIPRPGTYRLSAWYPSPAPETTAVLAIGHSVERRLMNAAVTSLAAAAAGVVLCGVIAAVTYVRRRNT